MAALTAGLLGGITGGLQAAFNGANFWTGEIRSASLSEETVQGFAGKKKTFPKFKDLKKNYPAARDAGGTSATSDPNFSGDNVNQCAMRLGKALQKSGVDMSSYPKVNLTSDGLPRSAKNLADWLWQNYGAPTRVAWSDFMNNIYPYKTGIYYLTPPPGPYAGHIDIFYYGVSGSHMYKGVDIWFWIVP